MPIRLLIAIAALVVATPALAATDWSSYGNARYGYEIAVPPGFVGDGEPDAHDGQVFRGSDGRTVLAVWGGLLGEGGFAAAAEARKGALAADGWLMAYVATTPGWAALSGTKGVRVLYTKQISACGGQHFAAFELRYTSRDINLMKPVVERLAASLRQRDCAPAQ